MKSSWLFLLIGGQGLFFYGMQVLSGGLKKVSGERLKSVFNLVTKLPIIGILVGMTVTCFIQSSSATTVLVVGFVNAGLLVLKQAISVIIGANIGTTCTAWLVSSMSVFKVTHYALPSVAIGFALTALGKTKRSKAIGEILIGFGILFIGLDFMKEAFGPLKDSQRVKDLFVLFSKNPLFGILVGLIFTVLVRSSSATVAVVQVLAFNGLISFPAAIPLILGDNIGTTITAQQAAIGANLNARRAAMAHTLFNVIGVAYMLVFLHTGWFVKAVDFIIPGAITQKNIMFYIAVAHTLFNVTNAFVFLPFIGMLEKASIFLVPKKKGTLDMGPQYLEKHLLDTPPLAMQQARNESIFMLSMASKAVNTSVEGFLAKDRQTMHKVDYYENVTDNLQTEITQYLIELSQRNLSEEESQELPVLIHNINDMERIGDHAENIAELAQVRVDDKIDFTKKAMKELSEIWNETEKMFQQAKEALGSNDVFIAQSMLESEERINQLQVKFKEAHIDRLNRGECKLNSNFVFLDFIDNLEKIADHLTNIAQSVIGKMQWSQYKQDKL